MSIAQPDTPDPHGRGSAKSAEPPTEIAEAAEDVITDPALDDQLGTDWADEGGATADGPATAPPTD